MHILMHQGQDPIGKIGKTRLLGNWKCEQQICSIHDSPSLFNVMYKQDLISMWNEDDGQGVVPMLHFFHLLYTLTKIRAEFQFSPTDILFQGYTYRNSIFGESFSFLSFLSFRFTTTNMSQWSDVLYRTNGTKAVVCVQGPIWQENSVRNWVHTEVI